MFFTSWTFQWPHEAPLLLSLDSLGSGLWTYFLSYVHLALYYAPTISPAKDEIEMMQI